MKESYVKTIPRIVKDFIRQCLDVKNYDMLRAHGVTEDRIEILKNPVHNGYQTVINEVFRKIMENIGYYKAFSDDSDMAKVLTPNHVINVLTKPSSCDIKPMSDFYKIYGVKQTLDYVTAFDKIQDCDLQLQGINSKLTCEKDDRCYRVVLDMPGTSNRYTTIRNELSNHDIIIGNNTYKISKGGVNVVWQCTFTQPTKVDIYLNKIRSANLKEEASYYLRYITEIPSDDKFYKGEVGTRQIRLDGYCDTSAFHFIVENKDVCLFLCQYPGHRYVVLDANCKMTVSEMMKLSFASFAALGMLEKTIYLDHCMIVASNTVDFANPIGIFFSRLSPSVKCEHAIFTNNVYSVLVPIGKRIFDGDSLKRDGEQRVIQLMHKFKLTCAINPITEDVFGNIVSNFLKYESLERGIYIILSMSSASLEMMGPTYAVALEAISNISRDVLPKRKTSQIDNTKWENNVRPALEKVLSDFAKAGYITAEEKDNLTKKIKNANQAFNTDKLDSLLKYYNYPLSKDDEQALKDRNTFLHGSLNIKKQKASALSISNLSDNLFSTALILHKLCCSIILLMSGYKGYIINNDLLYGLTDKGTAFIKIPKEKQV